MQLLAVLTIVVVLLMSTHEVSAFDDAAFQLSLDIIDKAVIQTLFNKESKMEVLNYINKYRQLISQVIRIIKQIDFKSLRKVQSRLKCLKILKSVHFPNVSFNLIKFIDNFKKFGLDIAKIKNLMPKLSRNIDLIQARMTSLGLDEEKLNKAKGKMAYTIYMISKIYSVVMYANMILKGTVFSQNLKQSESVSETATNKAA